MTNYDIQASANRIRKLRYDHHYTQETAATFLGIDYRTLGNIERAARGCSVDLFIRLSEFYDVSLDYLILGKQPGNTQLKTELSIVIDQLKELVQVM